MRALICSRKNIWALAWSPHQPHVLACGDADGQIYIFDTESGLLSGKLSADKASIWALAWSPIKPHILAALDGNLHIFDVLRGQKIVNIHGVTENTSLSVAWSANEALVIRSFEASDIESVQLQGIGGSISWKRKSSLRAPVTSFPGSTTPENGDSRQSSRSPSPVPPQRAGPSPVPVVAAPVSAPAPKSPSNLLSRSPLNASFSASQIEKAQKFSLAPPTEVLILAGCAPDLSGHGHVRACIELSCLRCGLSGDISIPHLLRQLTPDIPQRQH